MKKIPCVMMRGGTSRGAFLLAEHLPEDQTQRDKILMAIMGSGNDLEIDGIGGGNPLTSKVAIISRSSDPRADVDYLFAQVIVHEQRVDTTPNCGNMLSGVGAFAIENGLIAATSPVTRVRIRNVNTGTFIEADVQTPNGVVEYEGSARIDGVPGTAAPVALTFLNAAGTKTGKERRERDYGNYRRSAFGVDAAGIYGILGRYDYPVKKIKRNADRKQSAKTHQGYGVFWQADVFSREEP